jgi:hypothetical protein
MRESLKLGGEQFDYIRAIKWITEIQNIIYQNPQNHTVILKSVKAMTARVFTEHGWVTKHTDQAIDELLKIRAEQLLGLRDSIDAMNPRVLSTPTIQRTMKHVELFEQDGLNHQGPGQHTRQARSMFKISMIKN